MRVATAAALAQARPRSAAGASWKAARAARSQAGAPPLPRDRRAGRGEDPPQSSYAKTYAGARALGVELGLSIPDLVTAHRLLQHHGQTLCRRTEPDCPTCPVRESCAFGRAAR